MLRKILKPLTSPPVRNPQLDETLSQLVVAAPEIIRATLVRSGGVMLATYPRQAADNDRITIMTAAMDSLGERIAAELASGDLRYTLVAGTNGLHLMMVLSSEYLLELELRPNMSIGSALGALHASIAPFAEALKLKATGP